MSPLHTIGTQGWFGTETGDRFTQVALAGWFGGLPSEARRSLTPLRTYLRQRLVNDGGFASLLGAHGAVYHRHPPAPMPFPCTVYELIEDAPGRLLLSLRFLTQHPAMLDRMHDAAAHLLEGHRADVDGWRIHHITLTDASPREAVRTAHTVRHEQEVRYRITADALPAGQTATIRFLHAETELSLPRPAETSIETTRLQAPGESTGGTFYLYDAGQTHALHVLTLRTLTQADADALRAFFTEVEGMRHPFTYTDPDSVEYTVRFAERTLALLKRDAGTWDTTLRLRLA